MPDEKVSYLEPIEENISDAFQKPKEPSSSAELPQTPDYLKEKASPQENEAVYQKILKIASRSTPSASDDSVAGDHQDEAERISEETDVEMQVNRLTTLAQTRGVAYAISVAQKLNDFYLLDRMHDDLANRLYESLKTKGLIEEE